MKKYTKEIAVLAVLALFTPWANAQTANLNGTSGEVTGPTAGLQVTPAAGVAATNLISNDTGADPGTPITDSTSVPGVITVTTKEKLGQAAPQADYTSNDVVGGGTSSVVINNEGITLNQVQTTANAVVVDRFVTEVVTVTPGNPTTTVTTWTAELRDASGTVIAGSQSTYTDDVAQPNFGTKNNAIVDLETFVTNLAADNTSLSTATTSTPETPTGGNLTVSGNLAVGAIGNVEADVTANTAKVGVTDASVAATAAVTANTAKVGYTDALVSANADVTANTAKVGYTDAAVDVRIAGAMTDLGVSATGIDGVIEKSTNGDGDQIIKLGSNTFTFNNTTDTISTSSGDINLDADVAITGDLEIAGDVFVGGRSQGLQSQIDTNRADIDRNARGIAMVAALQHTTVLPDMKQALDLSAAHFEGETGMALNYARRINDNVQINFGAASTSDFDESVIKAGIGVQW